MLDNSDCKIAAADALTLLLHNQHALGAAIEEITKWLSENGVENVAVNSSGYGNFGHQCKSCYSCDYETTAVLGNRPWLQRK